LKLGCRSPWCHQINNKNLHYYVNPCSLCSFLLERPKKCKKEDTLQKMQSLFAEVSGEL